MKLFPTPVTCNYGQKRRAVTGAVATDAIKNNKTMSCNCRLGGSPATCTNAIPFPEATKHLGVLLGGYTFNTENLV